MYRSLRQRKYWIAEVLTRLQGSTYAKEKVFIETALDAINCKGDKMTRLDYVRTSALPFRASRYRYPFAYVYQTYLLLKFSFTVLFSPFAFAQGTTNPPLFVASHTLL
jgi:hypothetical protein